MGIYQCGVIVSEASLGVDCYWVETFILIGCPTQNTTQQFCKNQPKTECFKFFLVILHLIVKVLTPADEEQPQSRQSLEHCLAYHVKLHITHPIWKKEKNAID